MNHIKSEEFFLNLWSLKYRFKLKSFHLLRSGDFLPDKSLCLSWCLTVRGYSFGEKNIFYWQIYIYITDWCSEAFIFLFASLNIFFFFQFSYILESYKHKRKKQSRRSKDSRAERWSVRVCVQWACVWISLSRQMSTRFDSFIQPEKQWSSTNLCIR